MLVRVRFAFRRCTIYHQCILFLSLKELQNIANEILVLKMVLKENYNFICDKAATNIQTFSFCSITMQAFVN